MPSSRGSSCIAEGFFTGWATREALLGKMEGKQLYTCMLSLVSHVWLFATLWTVALQASLSMEFTRQEYWSGLPWPSLGDLPDPGVELMSLMSPALIGSFFNSNATWEAQTSVWSSKWAYYLHSYLDLRCHVLQLWKWVAFKVMKCIHKERVLKCLLCNWVFFFFFESFLRAVIMKIGFPLWFRW